MEGTKPRTASSIGMFDMLKGAGMLTIVFAHTAELYPMQAVSGLSLTAFFPFIYREALMAAFFIASGYGFRKRSIHKCIHQQLKSLLKPYAYTALFTCVLHFIIHYKTFQYLPGTIGESIKVTGGFLLGLPHTAKYFGQEFFSCGPMWYLLALMRPNPKKAQRTVGDVMREATEVARAAKALSCNHVAPTNSRQRGQAR